MSTYERFRKATQTEECRMFHCQDGLFFERQPNGFVRVVKTYDGRGIRPDNVICDVTLTTAAFASVCASMSARGETSDTFCEALEFLNAAVGRDDAMTLALRLCSENADTFSPEVREVMERLRPRIEKALAWDNVDSYGPSA